MHQGDSRLAWPTMTWLGLVVAAFVVLSLLVTATGTARFSAGMGYGAVAGYAIGALFDLAKGALLVAVLVFWSRRALSFAAVFAIIWACLATFSALATHATVTLAISASERTGTWKMEIRGNSKAELAAVEQQIAAFTRTGVPRPAKTVREDLAAQIVPPGVWKDSNECNGIRESAYFQKACAQVVRLRRELVAAEEYERLSTRAGELRKGLADAPIVATSDPLPEAFSATLGRVLPVSGNEGVALLLTVVVELMSAFGFAGLRSLANGKATGTADAGSLQVAVPPGAPPPAAARSFPRQRQATLPKASLPAVAPGGGRVLAHATRKIPNPPSHTQATLPAPSLLPAAC